ncbi:hypothetical protein J6590_050783 [Homalodisca vitripennis]|nr:hypothetical protein J6590_050783 [Homalodisca vitripennis]
MSDVVVSPPLPVSAELTPEQGLLSEWQSLNSHRWRAHLASLIAGCPPPSTLYIPLTLTFLSTYKLYVTELDPRTTGGMYLAIVIK